MKGKSSNRDVWSTGGFTLVEILIAMAVASLLVVSLLSIVSSSMDVSKQANAVMFSRSSAQAALDLMVTDLDSLVVNRNAGEVLQLVNGDLDASKLTLLTASMVDSYSTNGSGSAGMPCLVQYIIKYDTNYASSSKSFGLYRNVLDPTNTFSSVIGANLSAIPNSTNLLVPNVVKMNVNLYTNYGADIWNNGAALVTNITSTNLPSGVMVEVALTVLDEPYIQRFGSGLGVGNNSATNLIRQYGRTLIRRVSLPSPF